MRTVVYPVLYFTVDGISGELLPPPPHALEGGGPRLDYPRSHLSVYPIVDYRKLFYGLTHLITFCKNLISTAGKNTETTFRATNFIPEILFVHRNEQNLLLIMVTFAISLSIMKSGFTVFWLPNLAVNILHTLGHCHLWMPETGVERPPWLHDDDEEKRRLR